MEFQSFKKNEVLYINSYIKFLRELFEAKEYASLTPDAMLLYTLLLDRLAVSLNHKDDKIHFFDENEYVYVIFKQTDIMKKLHVKRGKYDSARKLLEKANLIQVKQQGNNLPNLIYVGKTKRMTESGKIIELSNAKNQHSEMLNSNNPDCKKSEIPNTYNKLNNINKYNSFCNKFFDGNGQYNDLDKYYIN